MWRRAPVRPPAVTSHIGEGIVFLRSGRRTEAAKQRPYRHEMHDEYSFLGLPRDPCFFAGIQLGRLRFDTGDHAEPPPRSR